MRWNTGMDRRRGSAVVVRAEASRSTESAREVLLDVGLYVAAEVRQQDARVADVLPAGRLLLLLLLIIDVHRPALVVITSSCRRLSDIVMSRLQHDVRDVTR